MSGDARNVRAFILMCRKNKRQEGKMAFSELGKLLELIEKVVEIMERTSGLPNNIGIGDLNEIRSNIFVLKQKVIKEGEN